MQTTVTQPLASDVEVRQGPSLFKRLANVQEAGLVAVMLDRLGGQWHAWRARGRQT